MSSHWAVKFFSPRQFLLYATPALAPRQIMGLITHDMNSAFFPEFSDLANVLILVYVPEEKYGKK